MPYEEITRMFSYSLVAYLVGPPAAGLEVGETDFDGFSSHGSAQRIRVPHLTASLMRWAARPSRSRRTPLLIASRLRSHKAPGK